MARVLLACTFLSGTARLAIAQDPALPLLTLDDALGRALHDNRAVKNAALEARKSEDVVAIAKSRRLPQFQVGAMAGSLLHSFDFTFPAGSFGTYEGIGQVPSMDAKITTPARFTTFVTAGFDQPLSQQYKLHLGIRASELARDIAAEGERAQRQKVASEVRKAYFDLVAAQSAADAARQAVRTLTEVQRVTSRHLSEQTVLRADAMEVDARLAKASYELSAAESRQASEREALNDLLGRDITTAFRVEPLAAEDSGGLTLEKARQKAAANRAELRQAQMAEQQADYGRRLAKADYIPDVSLSARYLGFYNFEVLPRHVTTAGVFVNWEPFDWKRRSRTVAEKTKVLEQARNTAQQAASQVAIEVGAIHRRWTDSALLVKATRTAFLAAAEQLRVVSDRYQQDSALLKDLLQAEARSSEAESQYQQALSSYWGATADLRRAMAEE